MKTSNLLYPAGLAMLGLAMVIGSLAVAEPAAETTAGKPEFQLPPGWTAEDMQACMVAGTPDKHHEELVNDAGVWHGKSQMWMAPGAEPIASECTSTLTPFMDGRFLQCTMEGEMPGMGPYNGFGLYGFDNMKQEYVAMWVDNHSTSIMNGKGERADDGKTWTWTYTALCPITKKPATMREVHTVTGANTRTLDMFGTDPKSGKEFKMMTIQLTRKGDARQASR